MRILRIIACLATLAPWAGAAELLFQDEFKEKLGPDWSWIREHREGWRLTEHGLEVRVEPGNMWGPQNDARNVLVRPAPDAAAAEIEVAVTVENHPTNQYEQVDLVWYFDDSDMVKLGEELVDGKLSVVMGREEHDQCRTIAIIPLESTTVRLRVLVRGSELRGQFRTPHASQWREVGRCNLPASTNFSAKVSLQFYQGPKEAAHWARVTDFRMLKHR